MDPYISNVLPFLPELGPKRHKGMLIIVAILESQTAKRARINIGKIFRAEKINVRWDQATVLGLCEFGLYTPHLPPSERHGVFVNLAKM